jgi:molybdenum cofactor biosynthesis enzyme MoaA
MMLKPLAYDDILQTADLWLEAGGRPEAEIGALEPLLWREGEKRIDDVVLALVKRGLKVSMTTNGQLLDSFVDKLKDSGLSLLRMSWHTTNPVMFKELSGGYGNYDRFLRGITRAANVGITISFNRLLLHGCEDDLPEQLRFIETHHCRLKLFTLLWTPAASTVYDQFYQDWRAIIRKYVLPRTEKIVRIGAVIGRKRLRFVLRNGGSIEVKLGDRLNRSIEPCGSCAFKSTCEEGFGDYVRIDPRLILYFCYLRRDLGLPLKQLFKNPSELQRKLQVAFPEVDARKILSSSALRFTVTPVCNFNCRVPGTDQGWCMEEPGEFVYPKIRPTLFKT